MSTAPTRPAGSELSVAAIFAASSAVLAASVLASFRQGFAEDLETAFTVNGARVLSAAAVGAVLALAGSLRLERGSERALRELELFAVSAGAAAGGFVAAQAAGSGMAGLVAFAAGAAIGGGVLFAGVRALDRPRRFANLLAALALAGMIAMAALVGSYGRARADAVGALVGWLLGDLAGATFASAGVLAIAALGLVLAAVGMRRDEAAGSRLAALALLAFGIGLGAAGPLVLVGSLVPRTVRHLTRTASEGARTAAAAVAGAATVAAVDAVPRLLVGGYDFPFNVPAGMLAIPILLGWNRARLRRAVGPAPWLFEGFEILVIVAMTLAAAGFAVLLARVIAFAT